MSPDQRLGPALLALGGTHEPSGSADAAAGTGTLDTKGRFQGRGQRGLSSRVILNWDSFSHKMTFKGAGNRLDKVVNRIEDI